MLGIRSTASLLLVGTHVNDSYSGEVNLQTAGDTVQTVWVTKEDRLTDTFLLCLHSSLHHRLMTTFSEDHTLWVLGRCGMECACELCLLSEELAQMLLVVIPVGNLPTGYAAVHGSLGHRSTYLCDKSRVYRFRNEVLRTEGEVIDMINLIYDVGHWFLGKLCYGFRRSHFHFLVDGRGMHVERTTEDIREANDIVYLVRLVGTSC